jgi:hypothetical protein
MTSTAPSMTNAWVIRHWSAAGAPSFVIGKVKNRPKAVFTLLAAHPFQTAGGMRPGWT